MSRRPRLRVGVGGRNASRLLERSDNSLQVRWLECPGTQSFNVGRFGEPDATPPLAALTISSQTASTAPNLPRRPIQVSLPDFLARRPAQGIDPARADGCCTTQRRPGDQPP